jgi:hypothetical protein
MQPCVGGGASISASLCSSQTFGVFLVQMTSNKAKNQCWKKPWSLLRRDLRKSLERDLLLVWSW